MSFSRSGSVGTRGFLGLVVGGVLAGALGAAQAVTLYDPGLASLPSAQGWLSSGTPGYAQSVSGGAWRLDTTAANAVMAGSARVGLAALDTLRGFELDFGLRVLSEAHARPERGGFSVIVTGIDPGHALELAFWGDRVFAYTADFAHGAEAMLDTSVATAYSLVVASHQYSLYGNGSLLLAGSMVDYSATGSPYDQSGLLFFGDDTSSARSSVDVGRIAVTAAVPEPTTWALLIVGLAGTLAWAGRRRRG